jgi:excisionase family DNA binding protein
MMKVFARRTTIAFDRHQEELMTVETDHVDPIAELATAHELKTAAKMLRISLPTIVRLVLNEKLFSYKVGNKRYVPHAEIERFIQDSAGANRRKLAPGGRSAKVRRQAAERAIGECKALGG